MKIPSMLLFAFLGFSFGGCTVPDPENLGEECDPTNYTSMDDNTECICEPDCANVDGGLINGSGEACTCVVEFGGA